MNWLTDGADREGIPVDIGVIGEDGDRDRGVLGGRGGIIRRDRGIINRMDGEGDGGGGGGALAVDEGIGEGIGAVEIGRGRIGDGGTVGLGGALRGLTDGADREGIPVDIGVIGEDGDRDRGARGGRDGIVDRDRGIIGRGGEYELAELVRIAALVVVKINGRYGKIILESFLEVGQGEGICPNGYKLCRTFVLEMRGSIFIASAGFSVVDSKALEIGQLGPIFIDCRCLPEYFCFSSPKSCSHREKVKESKSYRKSTALLPNLHGVSPS